MKIKKAFLYNLIAGLSCYLFFSVTAVAQNYFKVGGEVNIIGSQVDGDGYGGYNQLGFAGGLFVKHALNDKWLWKMDIRYIQKGSKHNPNEQEGDLTQYFLRINYMEVPFVFRYSGTNFYYEFGLAGSVFLSSYEEFNFSEITALRPFNRFEGSGTAGVGYILNDHIEVSFHGLYSFTPIRPYTSGSTYLLNFGQTSNALLIGLSYTLSGK